MDLLLDEFQATASTTDRTAAFGKGFDLALLGLFGEVGSLLSEVKKRQRDSVSFIGYEDAVVEEMGDVLWYLAAIARAAGIPLSSLAAQALGGQTPEKATFSRLQPQQALPFSLPTIAFEKTLLKLAAAVGVLTGFRTGDEDHVPADHLALQLASILGLLVDAANEAGVTLEVAAARNLAKTADRWQAKGSAPVFDESFPIEEQLPRALEVEIFERKAANGKHYVVQRVNGVFVGDRLTDNIMKPDDYRFHDAFHYAYAAVLGWSPVTRALLKLKRKSETSIDEGEDGARAILLEEAVATYVFGEAKQLEFFKGRMPGELSFTLLKSVRQFVRGYEAANCPLWLWEKAILQGNEAFRFLQERRRGKLAIDFANRQLTISELP